MEALIAWKTGANFGWEITGMGIRGGETDTAGPGAGEGKDSADRGRQSRDSKPKVLAVDDDPINLKLLSALLSGICDVEPALDAQTAVKMFLTGTYSLIFMDLHMPGMDGFECATLLRKLEKEKDLPRTPILAVTADNTPEAEGLALEAGIDEVVVKPLRHKMLLEEILKWQAAGKRAQGAP